MQQVSDEVLIDERPRSLAGMLPGRDENHLLGFRVFVDPESRDDVVGDSVADVLDLKRTG